MRIIRLLLTILALVSVILDLVSINNPVVYIVIFLLSIDLLVYFIGVITYDKIETFEKIKTYYISRIRNDNMFNYIYTIGIILSCYTIYGFNIYYTPIPILLVIFIATYNIMKYYDDEIEDIKKLQTEQILTVINTWKIGLMK